MKWSSAWLSRALRLIRKRELQVEWQKRAVHTALLDSGLQIPQEAAFRMAANRLHSEHLPAAGGDAVSAAFASRTAVASEVTMQRLADIAPAEVRTIWDY